MSDLIDYEVVKRAAAAVHEAMSPTSVAHGITFEKTDKAHRNYCERIARAVLVAAGWIAPAKKLGVPLAAEGHEAVTEGPGTGWKLSDSARDKIMEITGEVIRASGALHGVVLASLSDLPSDPTIHPNDEGLDVINHSELKGGDATSYRTTSAQCDEPPAETMAGAIAEERAPPGAR